MLALTLYLLGAMTMYFATRNIVEESVAFSLGFAIFWPGVIVAIGLMEICDRIFGE